MTTHSELLRAVRLARGHSSPAGLSAWAKTCGVSLTAQAIRNFENGKIPNKESRKALSAILHLSIDTTHRLEVLCAHAEISKRWGHLGLFVIDDLSRDTIAKELARVVLPNASRLEIAEAGERVTDCLTPIKHT
jgi:hypothetical protein